MEYVDVNVLESLHDFILCEAHKMILVIGHYYVNLSGCNLESFGYTVSISFPALLYTFHYIGNIFFFFIGMAVFGK